MAAIDREFSDMNVDNAIKWVGFIRSITVGLVVATSFVVAQYFALNTRLTLLEYQLTTIQSQLAEIRGDVRVLRERQQPNTNP
jgi:hypothetical protein